MIDLNATFFAQILNFLILVAILRALCYKPVVRMIKAREDKIAESLAKADSDVAEAESLKKDYQAQLAEAREKAQAIVDRERPVGADARVVGADETALDIAATVTLMDGSDLTAVETAFSDALAEFCRDNALRTRTVSYAKVLRLLLDTEGVADVTDFTLCGGGESLTLSETAAAVPGTVTLKEAGA